MGIRVIKTAIAASLAVYLAWLTGLEFYLSAGILAILSVEVTRKRNVQSAAQRLLASLVGLGIASLLFEVFGYHLWVLGLYVAISFPLLATIHLKDGIVTGAVIIFHVFEVGDVTIHSLQNEVYLLLIGIGTATVINLVYMPDQDAELVKRRLHIERYFAIIFRRIGEYLEKAESDWSGSELLIVEQEIATGSQMSLRTMENDMFSKSSAQWFQYFKMREEQFESLRQILTLSAQVSSSIPQGKILAEVFYLIGDDLKEDHYTGNTERKLDELETYFRSMSLPIDRTEFENRSALLQIMYEMRRYLAIARNKK